VQGVADCTLTAFVDSRYLQSPFTEQVEFGQGPRRESGPHAKADVSLPMTCRIWMQGQLLHIRERYPRQRERSRRCDGSSGADADMRCIRCDMPVGAGPFTADHRCTSGVNRSRKVTNSQIVRIDQGGVNARIIARETKTDFRRVEAASIKMPVCFTSAEGKRTFVRRFGPMQLNMYFISVIARTQLESVDVLKVEKTIRAQMDNVSGSMNKSLDAAEALCQHHGVTRLATYDTQPLEMEVGVISSTTRRYLEILAKLDQLMPMLQTLEIHDVLTLEEVVNQRSILKRQVRNIALSVRGFANGLRRRMRTPTAASDDEAPRLNRPLDEPLPPGSDGTEVALVDSVDEMAGGGDSRQELDAGVKVGATTTAGDGLVS